MSTLLFIGTVVLFTHNTRLHILLSSFRLKGGSYYFKFTYNFYICWWNLALSSSCLLSYFLIELQIEILQQKSITIGTLSVHYRYRHQPIHIDTVIMIDRYRWWWQPQKTSTIPKPKYSLHTYFHTIKQRLSILSLILWYTLHRWSFFCFSTSICWIYCIDQPKTFTLLLKSNILDFETLSYAHFYRINNVSYQQGPYGIRIISARSVSNTYRIGCGPNSPSSTRFAV